uniref:KIB1-4 beta-propeller domain-containing protein n=1 Tax=Leersia perrieri TaxID=77586 RepID=A0A0D9W288_9ORYZ
MSRAILLSHQKVCGKVGGWVALMDETASVAVLNPFTNSHIMLPPARKHVVAASSETMVMVDGKYAVQNAF